MSIYETLAGGALGIAGGIYQNAQNRQEAEKAFQRQRQLINEANIYNAPINQMKRLREAGLNPNLIYGQGPGSMVSASAGTPPAAHQENVMQNLGIYASMKQLDMQKRQLDLQERDIKLREQQNPSIIKKNEAEADKTNSEIDVNTHTIQSMLQTREYQSQLFELNKLALKLQNDSNKFDLEQRKELAPLVKLNHMLQNESVVNQIETNKVRLAYERELKDAKIKLNDEQIKEIGSKYDLNVQSKEFLTLMNDLQYTREWIETQEAKYNYNDPANEFLWSSKRVLNDFNLFKLVGAK